MEHSTCRFMVMVVVVSLEAVQEIWSHMKWPPEHLFSDANNDPSVRLWPQQPFHAWSVFILLFRTQVKSLILPTSLNVMKTVQGSLVLSV